MPRTHSGKYTLRRPNPIRIPDISSKVGARFAAKGAPVVTSASCPSLAGVPVDGRLALQRPQSLLCNSHSSPEDIVMGRSANQAERPGDLTSCIHCSKLRDISLQGWPPPSEVLAQSDGMVALSCDRPVAEHHFVILPIAHLQDARKLIYSDVPMIQNMVRLAVEVLQERRAPLEDSLMGFNWTYSMGRHLHMHVVSPFSRLSFLNRTITFRPDSLFFVTPQWLLNRLSMGHVKEERSKATSRTASPENLPSSVP